ncbi:receptor-like protein EIX1 [Triticum dicoccoides]|uniref:receptor-like protein EIX1 n=1 Tax=Triticum dicoccoides TaxID=85692 RepID=UPI00188E682E|nr:receptor-like protein EIX1 [Triticum dicoccoides]
MSKAPMGKLLLSNIHIVILVALLLFTRGKSFVESSSSSLSSNPNDTVASCIAGERSALVGFKAGLTDPTNFLSSWKGDDCCKWKGVHCSSINRHVVKLDLPGPGCEPNFIAPTQKLGGNISSSLLGLQHLQYLNISCNVFYGVQIPEFLGSLHKLRYIDLSMSSFTGRIPPQLGNLSNLQYLNLAGTDGTYSMDITWLSHLTSLEHLDLSGTNLGRVVHLLPVVNMIPSLKFLSLSGCNLRPSYGSLQLSNLTYLETLDLSFNSFHRPITPNWFWGLTSLKFLDIRENGFYGQFPDEIGNMTSIVKIDLSSNNLVGMIPSNLENLCSLKELYVSGNNINESITEFFLRLPGCSWNKLTYLHVDSTNLTGRLPIKLEPLSNLIYLDLSLNKLAGHVPLWIGELTKLAVLDLSNNNLDGFIHEGHLSGLESLEILWLSNNFIALTVNSTWVPPSNLTSIALGSCLLGPKFPPWLRWLTRLEILIISNTSISDTLPDWFWITASKLDTLNMRKNKIRGYLPSTMEFMTAYTIDLGSNQFNGPVPKLPIGLTDLDLSRNNLDGPLPLDFGAPGLAKLILFDNSISGTIPSSLCKLRSLVLLDISENKLIGPIPNCSVEASKNAMMSILNLSLRNNNLSGEFPSFLQYCQQLVFLDLAHNHFVGTLPTWIQEKLPYLAFLRVRSNMFFGNIPEELTKLANLQYLDLAYNNITGSIPKSIVNCQRMIATSHDHDHAFVGAFQFTIGLSDGIIDTVSYTENFTVVTKGQERLYTGEIIYMVNLDLSCNNLIGDIPEEISALVALKNLNLSWNNFSGKIPENIGALTQVESLDLSHNEISGGIPASLSALTSLSRLNLSYNTLTGDIPSGNQLQTLDDQEYIYIGNPGLCSPSLPQKCSQHKPIQATREHHEDLNDVASFFIAMGFGYVMGIWVVFCTFLSKRKWRVYWYSVCDSLYDWVYVRLVVTWASWTRGKCAKAETDR